MIPRCPGHGRHWYTFHGSVGFRSPVCVRCGYPNPRPLTGGEWDILLDYRTQRGRPFRDFIEKAITDRKAAV